MVSSTFLVSIFFHELILLNNNHYFVCNIHSAHFHFAKYLDSLLESRISALCELKSRQGTENDANRIAAIYEDEPCQKYLRDSVSHYGISLQLGQKHVYQALPRLIAMWLEFTSVEAVQDCDEMDKKELKRNGKLCSFALPNTTFCK